MAPRAHGDCHTGQYSRILKTEGFLEKISVLRSLIDE